MVAPKPSPLPKCEPEPKPITEPESEHSSSHNFHIGRADSDALYHLHRTTLANVCDCQCAHGSLNALALTAPKLKMQRPLPQV